MNRRRYALSGWRLRGWLGWWLAAVCLGCVPYGRSADPVLSEFLADNAGGLVDEDGDSSDWLEIYNPGPEAVDMGDWSLTDEVADPRKWSFPATPLAAGNYLVVFASGKDRHQSGAQLHTNFRLAAEGDYLALVRPDGTVASSFAPVFPPQYPDVSYGRVLVQKTLVLVATNAPVRTRIPVDDSLAQAWTLPEFDDRGWALGTNGVGFDTGGINGGEDLAIPVIQAAQPMVYWRFNEGQGQTPANLGTLAVPGFCENVVLGVEGLRPPTYGGFESDNLALQLDGSESYMGTGTPLLNHLRAFTLLAWIRPTAPQADRTGIMGQNDAVEFGFINSQTLQLWTPGGGSLEVSWSYPPNQWHQVAAVGDGSSLRIYLDGDLAGLSEATTDDYGASDSGFHVGGGGVFDAEGNWFEGQVDEAAVWSQALSPESIRQIHQASLAPALGPSFASQLATDLGAAMFGRNSSAYVRSGFAVDDPAKLNRLVLRVQYDDGFVAFLNGVPVASRNEPDPLRWNATATGYHGDAAALVFEEFDLSAQLSALRAGANVLALQGLNTSSTNSDFLLRAELVAGDYAGKPEQVGYLQPPTPGQPNNASTAQLGPLLSRVGSLPALPVQPLDTQDLVVTVKVSQAVFPIANATLNWRIMFGPTNQTSLMDDGRHQDGAADDGIYGGIIPASASTAGQLIRWFITVTDTEGRVSRWPFMPDPLDSEAFAGTVVASANLESRLPVIQLFWPSQAQAETRSGTRGCLFYQGELYDQVLISLRGQSTSGFAKKGFNLDFPRNHRFRYGPGSARARDAKLMTNYGDKSKTHNPLFCDLAGWVGCDAHWAFQIRVQANAAFHGIFDLMEDSDEAMLERLGRDPEGALYKMYNDLSSASGNEKKTRRQENFSDLQNLSSSLNPSLPLSTRVAYAYDNLDLPQAISYFAACALSSHQDHGHKNYYLYRDSVGTGEWAIFPWDVDLTWGRNWTDQQGYFSDTLYQDNVLNFYNQAQQSKGAVNRYYAVIFSHPDFRRMYLRRLRTLVDAHLPARGGVSNSGLIEGRIRQMLDQMDPADLTPSDATLDNAKWGLWGTPLSVREEIRRLTESYLPGRREFLLNHPAATLNGERLPDAQPSDAIVRVHTLEFNPPGGNPSQEFICLTNPQPYAVDLSGWRLERAIDHTFRPGTVVPAGGLLFVSPDVVAFRARPTSPRRGENLLVQGNYQGQLSARGETVEIRDATGRLVDSFAYAGDPSPAQQFLRITEIMYHPAESAASSAPKETLEYLELKNLGPTPLSLVGILLTNGVDFVFPDSGITQLAPGGCVLVVSDLAAFRARYGAAVPVAGEFRGSLDNAGEHLRLLDARHEEVLDFSFDDDWYPITDGFGFSLVVVDEHAAPDSWGDRAQWRSGGVYGGSPGSSDVARSFPPIQITEILTHPLPSQNDAIELHNPTDQAVDLSHWFLTDDRDQPAKFRIPDGTSLAAGGYLVFDETQFNPGAGQPTAFGLSAQGDEVYLLSADSAGQLTGYLDGFEFGAAALGVTFGRYVNRVGEVHYPAQKTATLGATNAGPRIGPLVINEIRYAPDAGQAEYIELKNITDTPVALAHPSWPDQTWRINGIDFVFPPDIIVPARGLVVITDVDPSVFRSQNEMPVNVLVFGPYAGALQDNGERVELQQPDPTAMATNHLAPMPYLTVDAVRYRDEAPWPTNAPGITGSLERISAEAYGDDPTNWRFSPGSPGMDNGGNRLPRVNAGLDLTLESVEFPLEIPLHGQVTDDGMPQPPGRVVVQWTQASGPGLVRWDDPHALTTTVQLPGTGAYVLQLNADDGALQAVDQMMLTVNRPAASGQFLVAPGAPWRYLDDGSNPGTAWRGISFDDHAWKTGAAKLGYGEGNESTVVSYGPNSQSKYITTYFRRAFSVEDTAALTGLTLLLLRDDGPVVYLNDQEIFRNNLPAGEITYRTAALNAVSGADESAYLEAAVDPNYLRPGTNLLAVEMHQNSASSSDLGFDLGLVARRTAVNQPPEVSAGPDQQSAGPTIPVILNGVFRDDGLPDPPGVTAVAWSLVDGPGLVTFAPTNLWRTTATFSLPGIYTLQLSADDGAQVRQDLVTVTIGHDPASSLRIDSVDAWWEDGLVLRIRFIAPRAGVYAIQHRDSLSEEPWRELTSLDAASDGQVMTATDRLPWPHPSRFYRVVLE